MCNRWQAGKGEGISPMQSMLIGLAGCAAVCTHGYDCILTFLQAEVVQIVQKQRKHLSGLSVEVDGQRAPKPDPRPMQTIHVKFVARSADLVEKDLSFAVDLSLEKYCGVFATLIKSADITWEVKVEPVAK
jgi:putative redox protein